ncbi:MAG: helicase-related protein [Candidatus Heimdallarchaeaceae archaeon]
MTTLPSKDSTFENREYQNYIINRIRHITDKGNSAILELDCGMGKRVIIYRLITEVFTKKKVVVFLQTHSSLQETRQYLKDNYGGIESLGTIETGLSSAQRKQIIEDYRVILSLPTAFNNTLKKYPELSKIINIAIVNEVDTIVRRLSRGKVLCVPWNNLIATLGNAMFIGMSGTLRDNHTILDEQQLKLRKELQTLLGFIPNSELITIEDFVGTDLEQYIQKTEVHLYPVDDEKTASIIQFLTEKINTVCEEIKQSATETNPSQISKLERNFYQQLPFIDVDTEIVQELNRLLLLRKYVYSMPSHSYLNHLFRQGFSKNELPPIPEASGKEHAVLKIAHNYHKTAILCSFLSTVHSLADQFREKGYEVFLIEGRTRNKNEIINEFRETKKQAVLIMSPVGERDLDIPQTNMLIVFDLVNSPKTVYQKMKRSRGGKVVLLFYDNTPEQTKVKRIVSEIIIRYPWSLIFYGDKLLQKI